MKSKHKIILPAALLLLCSCGSSKKTHRHVENSEIVSSAQLGVTTSDIKDNLKTEIRKTIEELDIVITEYDTQKAINTTTGRPPVKREVKAEKRRDEKKESVDECNEKKEKAVHNLDNVQVKDNLFVDNVKVKDETTVPLQIVKGIWAMCAFVGLKITWAIIRRITKN